MNQTIETDNHEILSWASTVLHNQGFLDISVRAKTAWSTVLKIATPKGNVYLKQTPPDLFIEVAVTNYLKKTCKIRDIPEIISENKDLNCFLMTECGDLSLRTLFDGKLNADLLIQGLEAYQDIQQLTVSHVDTLISAGVPDWRLEKFPNVYQSLIGQDKFLESHGLNNEQIDFLRKSIKTVKKFCLTLSSYKIPECLNHSDFHDNNMLYKKSTNRVTFIDLGETAINHPFFSLAGCLKVPCNRYGLSIDSEDYKKLYSACFSRWLADKESITRVMEIIDMLLPVYLLFTQKRLLDAIDLPQRSDDEISIKQHEKINKGFIWFIQNLEKTAS